MIENENIICISSIDWDFIWQGHQEIMSTLAANGNKVLFIENTGVRPPNLKDLPRLKKRVWNWFHSIKGIRQEKKNLFIYSPIILPFPYSRIARWINSGILVPPIIKWLKSVGFATPIIWTFLPTGLVLNVINALDNKLLVYYCIDNFSASSPRARRIRKSEDLLLKKADLVFVTAKNLYDRCSKYNSNVHIFPYGFNIEVYERANIQKDQEPQDIASIRHPIVGYVGGIHKWIDFELVKFLAEENPDKSFVFVGPLQVDVGDFKDIKNIHFLGQKRYEELPAYVSDFDTCIIPYLFTDYTRNVYPTKINEYLSLGKPVISTAIPEVEAFNDRNNGIIFVGKNKEEISSLISKAMLEGKNQELYDARIKTAIKEGSWRTKIDDMSKLISEKITEKERERSLRWKENILSLYKKSKKKLMPILAMVLIIYLVLFHTPFIWMIGSPLKVSNPPQKADSIIVFAGGVGESGKAGQGYEERVQYGVDLYKKGYARNLILSSGYKYAIKEAETMKIFAISLGIPENAIILEENARNTYENIKFSSDIMRKKHWRKAILISSPYHMRRASLVCQKVAPDLSVIYAPIPYSIFYGSGDRVYMKHIVAIFHEYAGIVYYYLKGYI